MSHKFYDSNSNLNSNPYKKRRTKCYFRDFQFQSYGNASLASPVCGKLGSMISADIHDQSDSYLCWVYSFASSTKTSLRIFVLSLSLSKSQRKRCLDKLDSKDFHHSLRNELCMVVPTDYKNKGAHQAMELRPMMIRVSH